MAYFGTLCTKFYYPNFLLYNENYFNQNSSIFTDSKSNRLRRIQGGAKAPRSRPAFSTDFKCILQNITTNMPDNVVYLL